MTNRPILTKPLVLAYSHSVPARHKDKVKEVAAHTASDWRRRTSPRSKVHLGLKEPSEEPSEQRTWS